MFRHRAEAGRVTAREPGGDGAGAEGAVGAQPPSWLSRFVGAVSVLEPLAERVAVVTGASRGLGAAIAQALAAAGASVAVAARTASTGDDSLPGSLEETVTAIRAAGGTGLAVPCDVTSGDDLVGLVERVTAELGAIDVLVNNAAATVPGRPGRRPTAAATAASLSTVPGVADVPMRAVRTQFEVNLLAPWRLMQLVLPVMFDRGRGWVVNIGSEAARMHGPAAATARARRRSSTSRDP